MIQIYKAGNTDYSRNGDYVLQPILCEFTCKINAEWELELEHVITEDVIRLLMIDSVIKAPAGIRGIEQEQLFRVYNTAKDFYTIHAYARPVFLDAAQDCFIPDSRPTDKNGQQALDIMCSGSRYSGKTDIGTVSTAYYINKNLIEAISGDDDNAFLKRWGGEILYNNYQIIINNHIGGDYGARAAFGYNLTGVEERADKEDVITRIVPVAYNGRMCSNPYYVDSPKIHNYPYIHHRIVKYEHIKLKEDMQGEPDEDDLVFNTLPELQAKLRELAAEEFKKGIDVPQVAYKVTIADIAQTEEYKDIKDLVEISLGDTVACTNKRLGITTQTRCVGIRYDCVSERILELKLGDAVWDVSDSLTEIYKAVTGTIDTGNGTLMADKVKGVLNLFNAQLKYQKNVAQKQDVRAILFEDTDTESDNYGALCIGSLGLQIADKRTTDGREWDWTTAITAKGAVADIIATGYMLADRIRGGTLTLGGANNVNGVFKVLDKKGNIVMSADTNGVNIKIGSVEEDAISEAYKGKLQSQFKVNTDAISAEVTRAKGSEETLRSSLKVTSDAVTAEVSRAKGAEETLKSSIKVTSDAVTTEVNRAKGAEESLKSSIKVTADNINSEVAKKVNGTQIISTINQSAEAVSIKADKINLNGAVTANQNFKILEDGSMETKYANIKGGEMSVGSNFKVTNGGIVYAFAPKFVLGMQLAKNMFSSIEDADYKYYAWYLGDNLWLGSQDGEDVWMPSIRPLKISAAGDIYSFGNISCFGTKSRIADTKNFSQKKLYCYEMASPMFGDCGTGCTDENGDCYISIDPVFEETIEQEPIVKLTKYGKGELYVSEINSGYFVVKGERNLKFAWEILGKQKGFGGLRLESDVPEKESIDRIESLYAGDREKEIEPILCYKEELEYDKESDEFYASYYR
ncbi:phage tail spike protein [Murimonas intestini]|uniref:Phage minor structural protein n=1 Tax=Murimonas intestini TaxID=1337051 RepID=A0AB73SZN9_9FIRM|nr:phage tail spike protein [Murimonas intestini]MCR1842751.1 phage tail protein [Murimonas intestini]MCR1867910.1 phage tail protein [Murimonas intestini]MCR1885262.1 phage tail protein [Murimonas intestini]